MYTTCGDDRERLQAYVSADAADAVRRQAEREGRSVSSWVARVVKTALRAEGELEEDSRSEEALEKGTGRDVYHPVGA